MEKTCQIIEPVPLQVDTIPAENASDFQMEMPLQGQAL